MNYNQTKLLIINNKKNLRMSIDFTINMRKNSYCFSFIQDLNVERA
jgi:hypothetical protein